MVERLDDFLLTTCNLFRSDNASTLFPVCVGGSWGYIDAAGRLKITPQFEWARDFSEKLAGVKLSGKWGFVDEDGAVVIVPEFSEVSEFSEGMAAVQRGGWGWGYIERGWGQILTLDFEQRRDDGRRLFSAQR